MCKWTTTKWESWRWLQKNTMRRLDCWNFYTLEFSVHFENVNMLFLFIFTQTKFLYLQTVFLWVRNIGTSVCGFSSGLTQMASIDMIYYLRKLVLSSPLVNVPLQSFEFQPDYKWQTYSKKNGKSNSFNIWISFCKMIPRDCFRVSL